MSNPFLDAVKGKTQTISNSPVSGNPFMDAIKTSQPIQTTPIPVEQPQKVGILDKVKNWFINKPQFTEPLAQAQIELQNAIKNPLSGSVGDMVKSFVDSVNQSYEGAQTAWQDLFNAIKKAPTEPLKAAGETYKAGTELIGSAFAPISSLLTAAGKAPIVGKLIDTAINLPYKVAGSLSGAGFDVILDKIPDNILNSKQKESIRGGVDAIGELAGQMAVGMIQGGALLKKSPILEKIKTETPELKSQIDKIPVQKVDELVNKFGEQDAKIIITKAAKKAKNEIIKTTETTKNPFMEVVGQKVGGVSEIPKELQPLAQEARKYKSAEEFVDNVAQKTNPIGGKSPENPKLFKIIIDNKLGDRNSLANFYNKVVGVKEVVKPEISIPPKPIETENKQFASRVFERMKVENSKLEGELMVSEMKLKEDAQKAIDLIATDKQRAYRVAMGVETLPDITSTSVNIAMAEKALSEGNYDLASKLIKNRSLEQTRRGQEIVAERGSITDNSVSKYIKELLASRLEALGKKYLSGVENVLKKTTDKTKAMKKIDTEVAKLEKQIKSKKLDVKTALSLLEKLTCIV